MRLAIIAASDYPQNGELAPLTNVAAQLDLLGQRLAEQDAGFYVHIFSAERGLAEGIENVIANATEPIDAVLFYFAGYAVVDDERGVALLLDGERLSTLSLKRVRRLLQQAAPTAFAILDTVSAFAVRDPDEVTHLLGEQIAAEDSGVTLLASNRPQPREGDTAASPFTKLLELVLDWQSSTEGLGAEALYAAMRAEETLFAELPAAHFYFGGRPFHVLTPGVPPAFSSPPPPLPPPSVPPAVARPSSLPMPGSAGSVPPPPPPPRSVPPAPSARKPLAAPPPLPPPSLAPPPFPPPSRAAPPPLPPASVAPPPLPPASVAPPPLPPASMAPPPLPASLAAPPPLPASLAAPPPLPSSLAPPPLPSFAEEAPGEALSQLERGGDFAGALSRVLDDLRQEPRRSTSYRSAARIFERCSDVEGAWQAASALEVLGEADINESLLAGTHRPEGLLPARGRVAEEDWNAKLFCAERDPTADSILWRVNAAAFEVGLETARRKRRLPALDPATEQNPTSSTATLAKTLLWTSQLLGVQLPRLYVVPELRGNLAIPPTPEPTLVVGRNLGSGLGLAELAFLWGRQLTLLRPEHRLLSVYPTTWELSALITAVLSLGGAPDLPFKSLEGDGKLFARGLKRHLSREKVADLRSLVGRLPTSQISNSALAWSRSVELAACRAGLLACGSVEIAAKMTERFPHGGLLTTEQQIDDILVWSLGPEHRRLRERLGVVIKG
jgi:hypothetical protein